MLVGLELRGGARSAARIADYTAEESIEELAELASGAGAKTLGSLIQTRAAPDPATLIGSGKVEEIKNWAEELGADLVLFDQNLTPTQQRNLERKLELPTLDRTQLILDIFARHARTREGKLQVELAQLSYLLPRLTGRGVSMSRLGGGIGTRGPGETQLETDRRRIGRRIDKLKADLEKVRSTRRLQRNRRQAVPLSAVALVGYTNVGKSTLFNALTAAGVTADAKMFATLDPTIRLLDLPSRRRILLSDTVGFIRNLPTTLVRAFRATLEEVSEAAMILHVVDLSSPRHREQIEQVDRLLAELGADAKPHILVLNKIDKLDPSEAEAVVRSEQADGGRAATTAISARTGRGLAELIEAVDRLLPGDDIETARFFFPYDAGERISFLYDHARVLARRDLEGGVEVEAAAPESVRRRLGCNLVTEEADRSVREIS